MEDRRTDARAFVRRYGLEFPHIFDPKGASAAKLGFFGLPTAYLVDRRGRIAGVLTGKQSERRLGRSLDLLALEP